MSALRNVIKSVDNTDAKAAEIRENLKILMELAESKAQIFEDEIKLDLKTGKTTDDLTVPITKVVKTSIQYRATSSEKTSDILGEVSSSINDMISDHSASGIVAGISKIASTALNTIMGVGEGEEQVVKLYSVVADYPAIVRFDFAFWSRKIAAESMKKYCETALACVAYKSAVDITKLAFNDFLALYGPILNEGFGSDPSKMKEMILQSKEIYNMYTDGPKATFSTGSSIQSHSSKMRSLHKSGPGSSFDPAQLNSKKPAMIFSTIQRATVGNF